MRLNVGKIQHWYWYYQLSVAIIPTQIATLVSTQYICIDTHNTESSSYTFLSVLKHAITENDLKFAAFPALSVGVNRYIPQEKGQRVYAEGDVGRGPVLLTHTLRLDGRNQ